MRFLIFTIITFISSSADFYQTALTLSVLLLVEHLVMLRKPEKLFKKISSGAMFFIYNAAMLSTIYFMTNPLERYGLIL